MARRVGFWAAVAAIVISAPTPLPIQAQPRGQTSDIAASFEGQAVLRAVCDTGSERRYSPGHGLSYDQAFKGRLLGWAMLDQLAAEADIPDVQRTALMRLSHIAGSISPPRTGKLIRACAQVRIALLPEQANPADVEAAVAAVKEAGVDGAQPLRHVLAELSEHSDPSAFAALINIARTMASSTAVPAPVRVSLATDLFVAASHGAVASRSGEFDRMAMTAAGSDPDQVARHLGRAFAAQTSSIFGATSDPTSQARAAEGLVKAWATLRERINPEALDNSTRVELASQLSRITDETIIAALESPAVFKPAPPDLIDDIARFGVTVQSDLRATTWSRRAIEGIVRRRASAMAESNATMVGVYLARPNDQLTHDFTSMSAANAVIGRDRERADVEPIWNWRSRVLTSELLERQIGQLGMLANGWPERRNAAVEAQLRMMQIQTRGGAALAAAAGLVRRYAGPSVDGKQPAVMAPFEFQLGFASRLRKIAAWAERLDDSPQTSAKIAAEVRAAYLLTTHARPELVRQLAGRVPGLNELVSPPPVSLARMRRGLRAGEVVVVAYPGMTETAIIAFDRDRILTTVAPVSDQEATDLVQAVRRSISSFTRDSRHPYDFAAAQRLYGATLAPAKRLLDGAQHVVWIGFGAYAALPPAILHDGNLFATERYSFSILTSLEELDGFGQQPGQPQPLRQIVGIGAAELEAVDLGGAAQSLDDAPDVLQSGLAKLYHIPAFLEGAKAAFGLEGPLLIGQQGATEAALRRATAKDADVLIIGAHGLLAREGAYQSAEPLIVLAPGTGTDSDDGVLRASEIGTLGLRRTRLVVLAACNTAGSDGRPNGEAMSGLARAFRSGSGADVIASHWAVFERATTGVLDAALRRIADGMAPPQALRTAMRESLSAADPARRHPGFWGAYVVIGNGGPIVTDRGMRQRLPGRAGAPLLRASG